jgi:hypothetical protein
MDNRIYADTAQARATDAPAPRKQLHGYGLSLLLTDEEISERLAAKALHDAEEKRRSNARIRGALSQMEVAFGYRPAPEPSAI